MAIASNPLDPEQSGKWLAAAGQERAEMDLFDPEMMEQVRSVFAPFFQQQQRAYTEEGGNVINREMARTGMAAGAQSAQRGVQPGSFVNAAQRRMAGKLVPGFHTGLQKMLAGQEGTFLNAASRAGQFKGQGQEAFMNSLAQLLQTGMQEQMQPEWWETALGGAIGGAAQIGSAFIGA